MSRQEKASERNKHQEVTDLWGLSLNCKKIFCSRALPILGEFEASTSHWAKANCTPPLPTLHGMKAVWGVLSVV